MNQEAPTDSRGQRQRRSSPRTASIPTEAGLSPPRAEEGGSPAAVQQPNRPAECCLSCVCLSTTRLQISAEGVGPDDCCPSSPAGQLAADGIDKDRRGSAEAIFRLRTRGRNTDAAVVTRSRNVEGKAVLFCCAKLHVVSDRCVPR